MTGVVVRRSSRDDAGRIAEVCNALASALHGEADVTEEFVRHWFELPDLEFWGAELDGRFVGHLDVRHKRDAGLFEVDIRVHPDARGAGVADALAETAESWCREHGRPGGGLRVYPDEREEELAAAARRRGYRLVRHSYEMRIELDGVPEEPDWPEGITPARFVAGRDEGRLHAAHMESFADHFGHVEIPLDEWRMHALRGPDVDPSLWVLAEEGGELAGLSMNGRHASGNPSFGWVAVLGVRPACRRRGIGEALLRASFAVLARHGVTRVGLGVDALNETGAVRLYERAGMAVARRQDVYELAL